MQLDINPTAAASYARTLIERGCEVSLAQRAAVILAQTSQGNPRNLEDQWIVSRAYAQLN